MRWIVDIVEDMQIMGIRRWRNQCKERANGRKSLRRLKPVVDCNASQRRKEWKFITDVLGQPILRVQESFWILVGPLSSGLLRSE